MLGNINSANGQCVNNIISYLKKDYKITIVCLKSEKDLPNENIFNSLRIIRIETREQKIRNKVSYVNTNSKNKFTKILYKILLRAVQLNKFISSHLSIYNINNKLVSEYLKGLNNINEKIDILIPVCFPFEAIISALEYKIKTGRKFKVIPYLLDKFSVSKTAHRTSINRIIKMRNHIKIEKSIFENSDHIIASKDWESHINKYLTNDMSKVYLTDIPSLTELNSPNNLALFEPKYINLVYTGSLNKKIRSPKYTLKLFSKCFEECEEIVLHLFIRGNCDRIVNNYALKFKNKLVNHGSVPIDIAHSAIQQANILVSVGNTDITQRPSKIYEYISSGKPIIHFYKDKNDPVIKILNKYEHSLCVPESKESFENNKKNIIDFINRFKSVETIKIEKVKRMFIQATPEFTAEIINRID